MKKEISQNVETVTHTNLKAGITLVALIITIIIMLILAGVTISLVINENGIFGKAILAKEKYEWAQNEEEKELENLYKQVGVPEKDLPENNEENPQPAGTEVKKEDSWYTQTPNYVNILDGSIAERTTTTISVRGIADGEGKTVPVPVGFYYVGGTVATGLVISDDARDQNKYANFTNTEDVPEGIPAGVIYNEDGTVKQEADLSEEEKKTVIFGNQFVWIPCTIGNYKKVTTFKNGSNGNAWGAMYASYSTSSSEKIQIEKYKGFYVGRYEAGTSKITLGDEKVAFTNQSTATVGKIKVERKSNHKSRRNTISSCGF